MAQDPRSKDPLKNIARNRGSVLNYTPSVPRAWLHVSREFRNVQKNKRSHVQKNSGITGCRNKVKERRRKRQAVIKLTSTSSKNITKEITQLVPRNRVSREQTIPLKAMIIQPRHVKNTDRVTRTSAMRKDNDKTRVKYLPATHSGQQTCVTRGKKEINLTVYREGNF